MRETHVALCDDDKCPWKHRGVDAEATHIAAEGHAASKRHTVTVYHEQRFTVRPSGA